MKNLVYILLFAVVNLGWSQRNTDLFESAKEHYSNDAFQEAIDDWQAILDNGEHSKAVYFNLGNAYYKLNETAPSIYYYEKALQLDPTDSEIKNNLAFAQNMRIDIIEPLPKTVFAKWYAKLSGFLSTKGWAVLSIAAILLMVISFLSYYFSANSRQKRLLFLASFLFLILTLGSFSMAYLTYTDAQNNQSAIVFAKVLEVKDAPTASGEVSFELHPGTKVTIADKQDDWLRIRLIDGKEGWVEATGLKEL